MPSPKALIMHSSFTATLISNLKAFPFAGEDMTAFTVCLLFKRLQDNPDCLRLMREEHDHVLSPSADSVKEILATSPHLLYKLPYTVAVIKETLRLHPLGLDGSRRLPFELVFPFHDSMAPSRFPYRGFQLG